MSELCYKKLLDLVLKKSSQSALSKRLEKSFQDILSSPVFKKINALPIPKDIRTDCDGAISIQSPTGYHASSELEETIKELVPWRKGPFNIFSHPIDSGWNSFIKYDHLKKKLPLLGGKTVLDLGCNNGYYLLRLLFDHQNTKPEALIGFEPHLQFYLQYSLIRRFIDSDILNLYPLGWKDLEYFEKTFDVILCMGILYHHPSPIDLLKTLSNSLKKGGEIILETMTINMEGSFALFPSKRYMGASGMWFIPTLECLLNWIKRSGFNQVEVFEHHLLDENEQISTPLSPFTSLNFQRHKKENKTIEGYLPPYRTYVRIQK